MIELEQACVLISQAATISSRARKALVSDGLLYWTICLTSQYSLSSLTCEKRLRPRYQMNWTVTDRCGQLTMMNCLYSQVTRGLYLLHAQPRQTVRHPVRLFQAQTSPQQSHLLPTMYILHHLLNSLRRYHHTVIAQFTCNPLSLLFDCQGRSSGITSTNRNSTCLRRLPPHMHQ